MDLMALIERVREHYVGQFEAFVRQQTASAVVCGAEVQFVLSEQTNHYRHFARVDFIRNDNGVEAVWFEPASTLEFEPFGGSFGTMRVIVEALRWDVVVIHHDLSDAPQLDDWFQRWFDPDDERHDPSASLGLFIHLLTIMPGCISVDFGTAPAEALWALLEQLELAGATRATINESLPLVA
jgi:hypothetical protein